MPSILAALLLGLGLLAPLAAHAQNSHPEPELGLQNEIRNTVISSANVQDFETLEKWAEEYRSTKASFESGGSILQQYYSSFTYLLKGGDTERAMKTWEQTAKKWMKAFPKSPTPYIAHANMLIAYAWSIRGDKVASEVWEEDWAKFHAELKKAETLLLKHKSVSDRDPNWYSKMIGLKMALKGSLQDVLDLAEEGTKKYPDFLPTYDAVFVYLHPNWHGNVNKMEAWAKIAAERSQEKHGNAVYAYLYKGLLGWSGADFFMRSKVDFARFKKGVSDGLERNPTKLGFAEARDVACQLKDAEWAKERWAALAKVAGPPMKAEIDPNGYCGWAVQAVVAAVPDLFEKRPDEVLDTGRLFDITAKIDDQSEEARLTGEILEKTHFTRFVDAWKETLLASANGVPGEAKSADENDKKIAKAWQEAVTSTLQVPEILKAMQATYAKSMSKDELKEIAAYFASPEGNKISVAEKPNPERDNDQAAWEPRLQKSQQRLNANPKRAEIIQNIMIADGSLETTVEFLINTSLSSSLATVSTLPKDQTPPSRQEIINAIEANRFQIKQSLSSTTLFILDDVFANLSDQELSGYLKHLQSPTGMKFATVGYEATKALLRNRSVAIAEAFARAFGTSGT